VKDSDLQQDGVGADQWLQIRETLIQQRVIAVTVNDEYVLCRDLSNLTLGQLADMVGIKPYLPQGDLAQDKHQLQALAGFAKVTSHLSSLDERVAEAFEVSLDVLFDDGAVAETPQPKATD
jgi:hypothetical protein